MRLNETCNMIIEQEYIENVVFSQPDGLRVEAVPKKVVMLCSIYSLFKDN